MKLAAAGAIADLVSADDLEKGIIIPSPFNKSIAADIAKAVADAAIKTGVAKI